MKIYIGERKYDVNVLVPTIAIVLTTILFNNINATTGVAVAIAGIFVTFLLSMHKYIFRKKVDAFLIIYQLFLFCLLHESIFHGFGPHHYTPIARKTIFLDWMWLVGFHVIRAIDVLDILEAYRINLTYIKSASAFSSSCLIAMHWMLDLFLITWILNKRFVESLQRYLPWWRYSLMFGVPSFLLVNWVPILSIVGLITTITFFISIFANLITFAKKGTTSNMSRSLFALSFVAFLACYLYIAITEKWSPTTTVIWWPIDNAIRLIDVGDTFQIIGVSLHNAPWGMLAATLSIWFRVLISFPIAKIVTHIRVVYLGGVILSPLELLEEMKSDVRGIREQAKTNVYNMLRRSKDCIPELVSDLSFVYNEMVITDVLRIITEVHPDWRSESCNLIELMKQLVETKRCKRVREILDMIDPKWRDSEAIHELTTYFISHIQEKRIKVHDNAIHALGNRAVEALPALHKMFRTGSHKEVCASLEAISRMKENALESFAHIIPLLAHRSYVIQGCADIALDCICKNWRTEHKDFARLEIEEFLRNTDNFMYRIRNISYYKRERRELQKILQELS